MNAQWDEIGEQVATLRGEPWTVRQASPVSGGCIHEAWQVTTETGKRWFVKINRRHLAAVFRAEAEGLGALAATGAIRVPGVAAWGEAGGRSFLVLEWLELAARTAPGERRLGESLARLHGHTGPAFGWERDNFLGQALQVNGWNGDWVAFFRDHRLAPQARRAREKGLRLEGWSRLLDCLEGFFGGHRPTPSLLHGDLWSGNAGYLHDGAPVVFDPAVYFGDAEADLAMAELFGGFGGAFWDGYRNLRPISSGYAVRRDLYNLYHILNHFNLFGGGYGAQANRLVATLTAELG